MVFFSTIRYFCIKFRYFIKFSFVFIYKIRIPDFSIYQNFKIYVTFLCILSVDRKIYEIVKFNLVCKKGSRRSLSSASDSDCCCAYE